MPNFSLLCPARNRLDKLENLINSLKDTTNNMEDIELLLAVDNDDLLTQRYIDNREHPFKIKVFIRERSEFFNRDYYNWLASFSAGKFLWAIGNDVVFKVKDWNKIINEKIEEYLRDKHNRIACIGVKDNIRTYSEPKDFASFPIITRDAYNFFGFVLHPEIKTWGADVVICVLYKQIGRYFHIDDNIYLDHVGYHAGTGTDELTTRAGDLYASSIQPQYVIDNIVPIQVSRYFKEKT